AVVADEVRKLAEKTMASTQDVSKAIQAIQESAAKSVGSMDRTVERVEQATTFAQQSGDALREIVTDAESTADEVRAIATASEEQSAASEEINRSVLGVSSISDESAKAMSEAAQSVAELNRQAQNLKTLIEQMQRS
ncbi:MAG: methyl-accepting chemotaxis protein, partial [Desulfovibrio sp.]